MGIFRTLRLTEAISTAPVLEATAATGVARTGIKSPWSSGVLSPVVYRDIFGHTSVDGPVSRTEAMTIPAVVKGVSLVTSSLSQCPLKTYELDAEVPSDAWLYATDGAVAPQYRLAFIVEDLILIGWSVVMVDRDDTGAITSGDRVRPDLWEFDELGNVVIGGEILDPTTYILIKGPHDGILNTGTRTLRAAINLENAWMRTVRNPIPTTLLQQVGDDQMDDDEVDDLLADWRAARQDPDGAVAYIPANIKVEALGTVMADVLVEARNAVAVDIARLIGTPAVSLDAGAVQSSLTYSNQEVANGLTLPLYGLAPYANAIGAALSMDNVCPPGRRIALDMTQLMADASTISRSGAPTED
jgi:hypothetical protein